MKSSVDRKRKKHAERMRRWRKRKLEKHIERTKDLPIRLDLHDLHVWTVDVKNRLDGTIHTFDLFVSQNRINSYRIVRNGEIWKKQMSITRFTTALRKAMPAVKIFQ